MSDAGARLKAAIDRDAELRETGRVAAQQLDAEATASLRPGVGLTPLSANPGLTSTETEPGQWQ